MEITLPPHVSAAWADESTLAAWLVAAATAEAERRAVAAAAGDAEAILAAARAPFIDGAPAPTEQTLAQRMEQIATNAVTLGTRLAVEAAGGDPEQVAQIVSEVVGAPD